VLHEDPPVKPIRVPLLRRYLAIAVACTWVVPGATAQSAAVPHPADARAPVPPADLRSTLPASAGGYLQSTDAPRLPWLHLFQPDGGFAPEPGSRPAAALAPGAAPAHSGHAGHAMPVKPPADAPMAAPMAAAPAASRDTRGVVRAVDAAEGKLTVQHEPIARLDMPGMTMVFRVKDKALLQGLAPGDVVSFDVEIDGTRFYVTGIDR
jgi:Cu/Ag efflux protein CusF